MSTRTVSISSSTDDSKLTGCVRVLALLKILTVTRSGAPMAVLENLMEIEDESNVYDSIEDI